MESQVPGSLIGSLPGQWFGSRMVLHAPILGANQADQQISIDIPLFNEFLFIWCTLALIVSAAQPI